MDHSSQPSGIPAIRAALEEDLPCFHKCPPGILPPVVCLFVLSMGLGADLLPLCHVIIIVVIPSVAKAIVSRTRGVDHRQCQGHNSDNDSRRCAHIRSRPPPFAPPGKPDTSQAQRNGETQSRPSLRPHNSCTSRSCTSAHIAGIPPGILGSSGTGRGHILGCVSIPEDAGCIRCTTGPGVGTGNPHSQHTLLLPLTCWRPSRQTMVVVFVFFRVQHLGHFGRSSTNKIIIFGRVAPG